MKTHGGKKGGERVRQMMVADQKNREEWNEKPLNLVLSRVRGMSG